MDKYRTDGHKLLYHIPRVHDWLEGKVVYPIYMEISPVGNCNHRCIFCAYDYIGHPNRKLETKRLLTFIDEIAECGIKSLLFAGEGEPLLHSDLDKFVIHAKNKGIDIGIFTNGHLWKKSIAEKILPYLTFIRFSFNGGTAENYAVIHKVGTEVFDKVLKNIETVVNIKEREKLDLDIGCQYVLLPENIDYLMQAIKILKDKGSDYFALKPFIQQSPQQFYKMTRQFSLSEINKVLEEAEKFSDENFRVIARRESFINYGVRNYKHCYGTTFISALNSEGDIASCLPYWDKEEFVFGNIYQNTFKGIWIGERRKEIKEFLENKLDMDGCPPNCRPNAVNEFLWEIRNPSGKHLNFI